MAVGVWRGVFAIGFCLALAACGSEDPAIPPEEAAPEPETLTSTDQFQATDSNFGPREEMPGAPLYAQHCAQCHDGTVPKAPHFSWLEMMTPRVMLRSLEEGIMQVQAAHLTDAERRHIVEYVTRAPAHTAEVAAVPMCDETVAFQAQMMVLLPVEAGSAL